MNNVKEPEKQKLLSKIELRLNYWKQKIAKLEKEVGEKLSEES